MRKERRKLHNVKNSCNITSLRTSEKKHISIVNNEILSKKSSYCRILLILLDNHKTVHVRL